jgi:hypothetical protein
MTNIHMHLSVGVSALTVIFVGYWLAPSHKKYVSYVLLLLGSICAVLLAESEWTLWLFAVSCGLAGVLYLNQEKA